MAQEGTLLGLEELSRAPQNPYRKIGPEQRQQVIKLKVQLPSWGAQWMKRDFDLTISEKAIRRIWRQEGLLRKKRRKHQTKNDLRAVKAKWRLFEQTCWDTKELTDIPELWLQIRRHNLPTIQYTTREVVSGLQLIAYAHERALCYSTLFAEIVLEHLQRCGVQFSDARVQSDNGSEFIGSWNARNDSSFTKTVQTIPGLTHTTIPPAAHRWQADVETVHNLIEDEFYMAETFISRRDFLNKASAYILWFNAARKNSSKGNKTPWEIIKQKNPKLNPEIVALPPLFLDELLNNKFHSKNKGGVRSYSVFHTVTKFELTFNPKSIIFQTMFLKIALTLWMTFVIFAAFLFARAAQGFPGETSRIMLFHVPQAWVATLAFLISMISSVLYLSKRRISDDLKAATAAELGFLFSVLATISGSIFAKVTWGSFWNWDPRETSIVILLMIYGAYFALRSAVPDPDRKRTFAAAYAILAFATVPFLVFILPRITISLHPENTMNPVDPQLDFRFLTVFIASLIAFTGLFFWMYSLKFKILKLEQDIFKGIDQWTMD